MFIDLAVRYLYCWPVGHKYHHYKLLGYPCWVCTRCLYTTSRSPGRGWFRQPIRKEAECQDSSIVTPTTRP